MKETLIFFSFNDFSKQDGGPVRMYGLLNALASENHKIIFYSNTSNFENFHPAIIHKPLNFVLSPTDKKKFQLLLSIFDYRVVNLLFKKMMMHLEEVLQEHRNDTLYFFEYLDNSVGYWLYKNKIIKNYVNDIHGIAPLEFRYQKENKGYINYLQFYLKEKSAELLDQKVLSNSIYNIYASRSMYEYFQNIYPNINENKIVIIPNLLSLDAFHREIDYGLMKEFKLRHNIYKDDIIIMFAGSFKLTGGVLDLIKAFEILKLEFNNLKLLLIGEGPEKVNCEEYISNHNLDRSVILTGRTPYKNLPTYQELANIIVCPDQDNPYSQLIIHLKYLDSLLSNKIVIAGDFESVKELNNNELLSLNFKPSDIGSLTNTIRKAIVNIDNLSDMYKHNRTYALENLTYLETIKDISL